MTSRRRGVSSRGGGFSNKGLNVETGTITKIIADKGFGFIALKESADVFFHRSALDPQLEFGEQLIERRVEFNLVNTERGMKAGNVRPAN